MDHITLTERAARRIGEILRREPPGSMLRVSVEGDGDGVTVEVPQRAAALSQVLTIRCRPARPGDLRKQLILRTDLNEQVTVNVEVRAVP